MAQDEEVVKEVQVAVEIVEEGVVHMCRAHKCICPCTDTNQSVYNWYTAASCIASETLKKKPTLFFETEKMDMFELDETYIIQHGSSKDLVKRVTDCIKISDELAHIKPRKDKRKWNDSGMTVHYICLSTNTEPNVSSMRLVYDNTYCVIDYLYTVPYARKMGIGSKMVNFATRFAMTGMPRILLCLATENSCVYWMSFGFVLKELGEKERLNPYDDTHLLSL